MNKKDRGMLVGLVLGDGCLYKYQPSDRKGAKKPHYVKLLINHSSAQEEFIKHKASLIHSIFGGKKPKVSFFLNNGFPAYSMTKQDVYFRILRSWIYPNDKKTLSRKILNMLTLEGVAIWYMDDGNLSAKKRNGKIHAYELFINTGETKEANQIIIDYFNEVHGIRFGQIKNNGSYRLRCGTKEARKFIPLIEPYIIPSMRYKIEMK